MGEDLRQEEQDDIQHRDRCEGAENKNANGVEDLTHAMKKAETLIDNLQANMDSLEAKVAQLDDDIAKSNQDLNQLLKMRNAEVKEFRTAMKDDTDAVAILNQALAAIQSFYKRNRISMTSLLAKKAAHKEEPEYTADADKAPETTWSGANYGGRKSETTGIVAIFEMLIEDVKNEMKTAQADDAKNEELYEKQRADLQESLDAQTALKIATETELADTKAKKQDTEDLHNSKSNDLNAENDLTTAIHNDCAWVGTHFQSRQSKRKAEIQGLQEAKIFLSGGQI